MCGSKSAVNLTEKNHCINVPDLLLQHGHTTHECLRTLSIKLMSVHLSIPLVMVTKTFSTCNTAMDNFQLTSHAHISVVLLPFRKSALAAAFLCITAAEKYQQSQFCSSLYREKHAVNTFSSHCFIFYRSSLQ